jgi:uncharacterized protein YecT (DUF1311 family)
MFKKWNKTLTGLGIANCIILIWIVNYYLDLENGMGIIAAIVAPVYALIFFIAIIILALIKRKIWFKQDMLASTLLMLLFCTPIPVLSAWYLTQPSTTLHSTETALSGNRIYKTEEVVNGDQVTEVRHWIKANNTAYLKDSLWIWMNKNGDTLQIENYTGEKLLNKKNVASDSLIINALEEAAQTQPEINSAAWREYKNADDQLNRVYQNILKEYKYDSLFIQRLKESQRIWITFKEAELAMKFPAENKSYAYGSIYSKCEAMFLKELTEDRTTKLKIWLEGIEEGNMCNGSVKMK